MSKINIIDSSIYNRISAGEVIERPMSVVKECVENSIDGKAKNISVYVSNNAKNLRIIDDGIGMSKEDAKIAFLPHTTSKISKVEDLEMISTLGFRGEALASIASVSMVTLNTCDIETKESTKVEIKGGVIEDISPSSLTVGTDINVENLFFNTPVREKFLKSVKSEESAITDLVSKFILAYPEISIKYYLNDKLVFKFDGNGFEKAVYAVYGKDILENCIYIDEIKGSIQIKGYVSKIGYTKPNKSYQTVILNGRNVVNETISMSIYKAYQPFLMKRCFPLYILHISIPADFVDVNVHPTKHDIRFSDNGKVFSAVYSGISNGIKSKSDLSFGSEEITKAFSSSKITFSGKQETISKDGYTVDNQELFSVNSTEKIIDNSIFAKAKDITPYKIIENYSPKQAVIQNSDGLKSIGIYEKPAQPNFNNGFYLRDSQSYIKNAPDLDTLRIIGVYNKTYIIAECDNDLYLVDQHAAHERILFDKYTLSFYNQNVLIQDLLVPYILTLNSTEEQFLRKNLSNLVVLGFNIEEFGSRTYRVTSIPAELSDIDFDKFFGEIFSDLNNMTSLNSSDLLREELMQKACKNAVKGGQPLSDMEIKEIFLMLQKTEVLTCPHGRPIIVTFTKTDVEKLFKRIVK